MSVTTHNIDGAEIQIVGVIGNDDIERWADTQPTEATRWARAILKGESTHNVSVDKISPNTFEIEDIDKEAYVTVRIQ